MPNVGVQEIGGTLARVTGKTWRFGDFTFQGSGDTLALSADGRYEVAYELDIEDGQGEWFGRGMSNNPLQAQGFAGIRIVNDTAAAQAEGSWRISVRNNQNEHLYTLSEGDLATYDLFDADNNELARKDQEPYPNQQANYETEPHKLTIDFNVDSDITMDNAESQTRMKFDGYRATAIE